MRRNWTVTALLLAVVFGAGACARGRSKDHARLAAPNALTERFSQSRLAPWNVRASAAGARCDILLVETSVRMADAMVEALHYGAGAHAVYENGLQQFYRDHSFRGVVYRDSAGNIWTYGAITPAVAEAIEPCR